MQFSTTPTLEGQVIVEYCGVVTGEAILGANIFRDFFAGIRDIVGGDRARMKKSCARRVKSRFANWATRRRRWAPMRLSGSTSIMKPSVKTAAC